MRYFFDTEFYETPNHMELISIGIVALDGRAYYAENKVFDWRPHNPNLDWTNTDGWLWNNVRPHLLQEEKYPTEIARDILDFIGNDVDPQFWAYFADYDWVNLCWLFGRMVDLPNRFPMWCRDLKQLAWHLNVSKDEFPKQQDTEHNALSDAMHNREVFMFLVGKAAGKVRV